METVRGLSLWLGAALVGSLGGTIIGNIALQGGWSEASIRMLLAIATTTLFFTVPGAGLLGLAFAWTRNRGLGLMLRLALLVPVGAVFGGALMALSGSVPVAIAGLTYGGATGLGWAMLHAALYGHARRKAPDTPLA